jgi:hypothetical protein
LTDIVPSHVQALDSVEFIDDLQRVGRAIATTQVHRDHFRGFAGRPADARPHEA